MEFVWSGVDWCGVVWSGVEWCGVVWSTCGVVTVMWSKVWSGGSDNGVVYAVVESVWTWCPKI